MPKEIEASVQMRLYTLSKRWLAVVLLIFILSIVVTVLIGIAGPSVIYTSEEVVPVEPDGFDPEVNTFTVMTRLPLNSFNQQLWLSMQPVTPDAAPSPIDGSVEVTVMLFKVTADNEEIVGRQSRHQREVSCTDQSCGKLVLVHLSHIENETYKVTAAIRGLARVAQFTSIRFTFSCYKSAFTQLEIWFRLTFLVITFITSMLYSRSLRLYLWKDFSIEQRWTAVLLPLLLLYNNPLFSLMFLMHSFLPLLIDAVFQATFLAALLMFWLCLFHSFRNRERPFLRFYLPKLVIVGLMWLSAVVLAFWQEIHEARDPTFNFRVDTVNFLGFKIFLFCLASIYCLLFLYYLIRAFVELRNTAYFDIRLKFTSLLMLVVFAVSMAIMMMRFGTGILDPNFVEEISTRYSNSAEFLSLYGLINLYVYTMAYIYSPSKNAYLESQLHDNPIVSMLNESDEDVVYGASDQTTNFMSKFADSD